jgi:hypothetical protein
MTGEQSNADSDTRFAGDSDSLLSLHRETGRVPHKGLILAEKVPAGQTRAD